MDARESTVRILDNLFGLHSENLGNALDRTSLRHSLLTSNLANLNTPGFKRRDVDFGVTLGDEMSKLKHRPGAEIRVDNGSRRMDGNSVDLEQEVMGIAQTELRYQALTDMTSRYFSGLKNVIKEGR
ncbi:MAG TPA: flagellar basal body protein [Fimbriimonadaceae bacterium]|nr:flagellar basal body protein [Fimbriimonadaceae bacterium]